ncbi:uncharacterized protein PV06_08725 [Exophiala oligosperma]|uniref:Septation initiation network scaffold protein cdc11 n=1 Tax=Exophiala oligosperma TaxID=215243 RepID=A0A0D2AFF5_9EURO|nr:uncharacterized protein PV06_08725 [Exophiala oligosperma]KIW38901.1 hypothetical protein PV06_08725 [Exophiala oligosperma]
MEPWLDSLSEDWKSEHQSSSPAPSFSSNRHNGNSSLSRSQSRIPHLAKNMRKESTTGSFLRHRSQRSHSRADGEPILRERSASSLNLPPTNGSNKTTSLPRRPSSVFSESQNSVQHHTIDEPPASAETPEWKRRLVNGEDIASDGFDLFSPSKLEGIFKQPTSSVLPSDNDAVENDGSIRRKPFSLAISNSFPEQYSSVRGTRSRLNLAVLEEINEEEESEHQNQPKGPHPTLERGSIQELAEQRMRSLARARHDNSSTPSSRPSSSEYGSVVQRQASTHVPDPRWRTISGQEELRNEFISPVTISKQNSIRETIMRKPTSVNIQALDTKLREAAYDSPRPTSSSSDRDVSYGNGNGTGHEPERFDELLPDLTSQSLPDDLSMGTQDFVAGGGFINSRRGGRSNDNSFLRKSLSLLHDNSKIDSQNRDFTFNSSPPQSSRFWDESIDQSKISASAPATPPDTSVVHHAESRIRPTSSGSPLKLFGNRDTYTNNKLMRILSHFEPEATHDESKSNDSGDEEQDNVFRMSQFGQGELDGFGFEQNVRRPSPVDIGDIGSDDRIFQPKAAVTAQRSPVNDKEECSGPIKDAQERDRLTKRRKTLMQEQVTIDDNELEVKICSIEEKATLAGKKRTDARPGSDPAQAEPEVLATRNLLKPKSARRLSVGKSATGDTTDTGGEEEGLEGLQHDLTEALAAELATFTHEATKANEDSRKPSLATKDYMEEANKVMQFIRARGKPVPVVNEMSEPGNASELNADAILDLSLDADSTKDDFSRPPSRDYPSKPVPERRHARHDSRTASYLKRYQDQDDLDALASISVFGTWAPSDNRLAAEAASVPVPDEFQESDPPNIRIRGHNETLRKRKYSTSTVEGLASGQSSLQHSFPTNSSTGSGQKGVITSGTVSIPDKVGAMTFDHDKKIWVKKMQVTVSPKVVYLEGVSEDDPFESIPDLSIDEKQEMRSRARQNQRAAQGQKHVDFPPTPTSWEEPFPPRRPLQELEPEVVMKRDQAFTAPQDQDEGDVNQSSLRSKVSEHEVKLQSGVPSKPPTELKENRKQARVVTIAFSSPVVSGINYANMSDEDFDALPREDDLPLDESYINLEDDIEDVVTSHHVQKKFAVTVDDRQALTFQPRTISPIEEQDEEQPVAHTSLVNSNRFHELTPAAPRTVAKLQKSGQKAASILCLTPLSDFSLHQVDKGPYHDQSYVEDRKRPNALRQAHGSLALAVDQLVKAITDAVQDELFWEELRRLKLDENKISSVHALNEYCPVLEQLSVSGNQLRQLDGLPSTLRILDIHNNMLNDLGSWSHLHNLQYLDVSGNELESLECFSSLVHLRSLKANNNRITNIDGVLDLDSLLDLQLNDNRLTSASFEGSELTRLRTLELNNNRLKEVKSLESLPALESLSVCNNGLEEFGQDVQSQGLILKELRLSHNALEAIHLNKMPALRYLDLDNNRIKTMYSLSLAYNLEFLSLREQFDSAHIVDAILSTPNECRTIRLSSNSVTSGMFKLPPTPQNNLRELEIAACGIAEFPEGFGAAFPNCRSLNANFNAVKDIAPLRRMVHLKDLLLAKNRVKKLRRTCLVLSRLGSLKQVDLRDNPLTVGFYSPVQNVVDSDGISSEARYHLPRGSAGEDANWVKLLDDVTGMKRRTIELLLADHCKGLVELDGLCFSRVPSDQEDETWTKLTDQKVLMKPVLAQVPTANIAEKMTRMDGDVSRCSLPGNFAASGMEGSMIMDCDVFDG